MSSVASTDNHLMTHYRNNTQYEQLQCGEVCKENNMKDMDVSYLQYQDRNAYEPMSLFLGRYKSDVLDPINQYKDDARLMRSYHEYFADKLRQDVFKRIHTHTIAEYVSFTITNDGLLTFSKPLPLII